MEDRKFEYAQGPESLRACDHQTSQATYVVEGLAANEAKADGGSAKWGFRKVVETVDAAEDQAPTCEEAKQPFGAAK
jgi:hypothetical protein